MSEWRELTWDDARRCGYEANAWLAMARELAWQRDDYGGRAAR